MLPKSASLISSWFKGQKDVELSFHGVFQVNYETLAYSKPTVDLVKLGRLLADGQPIFLTRS